MRELPPPGIYPNVLPAHYHGWKCASNSRLKILEGRSPAHVTASLEEQPKTYKGAPGSRVTAMGLGSAVHAATLEPANFDKWYALRPEGSANSKPYKAARARLIGDRPFVTVLHVDDYEICRRVAEAVRSHPRAGELIQSAQPGCELTLVWEHVVQLDGEEYSVTCKGRLDAPVPGVDGGLVDLKTTLNAAPEAFGKQAFSDDLKYWRQGAMYVDAAIQAGLEIPANVLLIAAEKEPPWGVKIYTVPSKWLTRGALEIELLLEQWAQCEKSGLWPNYDDLITPLLVPGWKERELDHPPALLEVA